MLSCHACYGTYKVNAASMLSHNLQSTHAVGLADAGRM